MNLTLGKVPRSEILVEIWSQRLEPELNHDVKCMAQCGVRAVYRVYVIPWGGDRVVRASSGGHEGFDEDLPSHEERSDDVFTRHTQNKYGQHSNVHG
uniref:Uncharacterized protein n=1 Tax=Physcomitrium patens TaxID=3218 RepID=A0A2K1L0N2_PHYPA|nr:hypothetical protein PHYPA_002375 [Physcomitrium patens]